MIYKDWMRNCNSDLIYRYWLSQAKCKDSITIDNITYYKMWYGVYKTMRSPFLDLIPFVNNNLNKNNTMEDYQKRILEEKDQIDTRLEKLREFLGTDKSGGSDPEELLRLKSQQCIMTNYSAVLQERINAWPKSEDSPKVPTGIVEPNVTSGKQSNKPVGLTNPQGVTGAGLGSTHSTEGSPASNPQGVTGDTPKTVPVVTKPAGS